MSGNITVTLAGLPYDGDHTPPTRAVVWAFPLAVATAEYTDAAQATVTLQHPMQDAQPSGDSAALTISVLRVTVETQNKDGMWIAWYEGCSAFATAANLLLYNCAKPTEKCTIRYMIDDPQTAPMVDIDAATRVTTHFDEQIIRAPNTIFITSTPIRYTDPGLATINTSMMRDVL